MGAKKSPIERCCKNCGYSDQQSDEEKQTRCKKNAPGFKNSIVSFPCKDIDDVCDGYENEFEYDIKNRISGTYRLHYCVNCIFWVQNDGEKLGNCIRNAPGEGCRTTMFLDWCGEWSGNYEG